MTYHLATRHSRSRAHRNVVLLLVLAVLGVVWAELAVGLFT